MSPHSKPIGSYLIPITNLDLDLNCSSACVRSDHRCRSNMVFDIISRYFRVRKFFSFLWLNSRVVIVEMFKVASKQISGSAPWLSQVTASSKDIWWIHRTLKRPVAGTNSFFPLSLCRCVPHLVSMHWSTHTDQAAQATCKPQAKAEWIKGGWKSWHGGLGQRVEGEGWEDLLLSLLEVQ